MEQRPTNALPSDSEPGAFDGPSGATTQSATHSPAPRVIVEQEARSVVIAAEADDDQTPPRGTAPPPSASPSTRPRELTPYARSNEPTHRAKVRRRSAANQWDRLRQPAVLAAAVGGLAGLTLLLYLGWVAITALVAAPRAARPLPSVGTAASGRSADADLEAPVLLDDLPVEKN